MSILGSSCQFVQKVWHRFRVLFNIQKKVTRHMLSSVASSFNDVMMMPLQIHTSDEAFDAGDRSKRLCCTGGTKFSTAFPTSLRNESLAGRQLKMRKLQHSVKILTLNILSYHMMTFFDNGQNMNVL